MNVKNANGSYAKTITHKGGIIRQRARTFQAEVNFQGERPRQSFPTLAEAKLWIEQKLIELKNEGIASMTLTKDQRDDASRAIRLLDGSTTLEAAARFYMIHNRSVEHITLADAIAIHLEHGATHLDGKSLRERRSVLGGFLKFKGNVPLVEVSKIDINDYINQHRAGRSVKTRQGDRGNLSPFFNFTIGRNMLKDNPVAGVKIEGQSTYRPAPKGILTPEQMETLLTKACELKRDHLVAAFVLIAFVGVRKSELHRMKWEDVSFDKRYVFISEQDDKNAQSRYITLEDNALAWLRSVKRDSGLICAEAMYKRYWETIVEKAAISPWPSNALRHSYGSYFLQRDEKMDAALTAFNMGNTVAVVNKHYRKPVPPDEVVKYWGINPRPFG